MAPPIRPGCALVIASSAKEQFVGPFWISTGIVALAEMGDKTQLLALILAARFKKPLPIILGMFVATILNHGLAGAVGAWITANIDPEWLRLGLGISFIAMALWALIPDKLESNGLTFHQRMGVFGATFLLFFMAEIGDKTQIATVALAAQYPNVFAVVIGTTVGMMIANVPVVLFGSRTISRIPMRPLRWAAAMAFLVFGVWTLFYANSLPLG